MELIKSGIRHLLLFFLTMGHLNGQDMYWEESTVICFEKENPVVNKALTVLREEIASRSSIKLTFANQWPTNAPSIIAIGIEGRLDNFPQELRDQASQLPAIKSEGYKLILDQDSRTLIIIGYDGRGVLYGVGKFLRKMQADDNGILLPNDLTLATSPRYPIRGHQMGYRPKTNAYDAFTVERFDQYIRDLAIFGANSIEIVPPRTDDDFTSVHMKIPAIEMIGEQSRIADSYGMDVWMWYPNMGTDYSTPDSVEVELAERHAVFQALPRLDALFVPGGDPGDLEPDILFDWLQKEAEVLHEYHPNAKIWVSPQVFRPDDAWYDAFYAHVDKKYSWFGGLVFGPWIKTPLQWIRERVGPEIPIRRYPDITHSLSSQYPVPKWDLAYAITLGRECINPRPQDEKMIHNAFDELAQGSISYSEGTNDDVNKFVWSDQDWDPETPVIETLRDYARFFIGSEESENVAQGLMALEENIQGDLLTNDGVLRTLAQWEDMEEDAPDEVINNYRFQMGLLRAYFDAYQHRRLIYETAIEEKAREELAKARMIGSAAAMALAKKHLTQALDRPAETSWKIRINELGDDLFENIGAQLTVKKHHAAEGRGNFLDNIDLPLNDAPWLLDQMKVIERIEKEQDRVVFIDSILHRSNPGPGGFYDNFGSPRSWERVLSEKSVTDDPGNLETPRVSFGVGLLGEEWVHEITATGFDGQSTPLAWMHQVTTLYDLPLKIRYDHLNPNNSYKIRAAYTGRFRSKMKLAADGLPIHDFIQTGTQPIYEFDIPNKALQDGTVQFEFTCGQGERGAQVSELWIIKKDT